MKTIIHYEGNVYETPSYDASVEDTAKALYADLDRIDKMQFKLKGGGYLLLSGEAVKRCAFMVLDS